MPKKSEYKILLRELRADLSTAKNELRYVKAQIKGQPAVEARLREEVAEWREKYEDLLLTPEVKADTEEAFKRGEAAALRKFKSWLISSTSDLEVAFKASDEE